MKNNTCQHGRDYFMRIANLRGKTNTWVRVVCLVHPTVSGAFSVVCIELGTTL